MLEGRETEGTLRWGRTATPMRMEICCTIFIPVCLACHDFLLLQTALKKGSRAGIPRALATTENALAVVFLTYSSTLSISGRMAAIMVANPAACTSQRNVLSENVVSIPGTAKNPCSMYGCLAWVTWNACWQPTQMASYFTTPGVLSTAKEQSCNHFRSFFFRTLLLCRRITTQAILGGQSCMTRVPVG